LTELDGQEPRWLRAATRVLQETPPPNDLWRQRLLHQIATLPRPRPVHGDAATRRAWSLRPLTAIAAGLACAFVGAAAAALVLRDAGPAPSAGIAAAPAAARSTVRFTLLAPTASRVALVGDFNGWNPAAVPLRRSTDGRTWEVELPLAPGRYVYSFVVDGALARDPAAPQAAGDDFGSPSSVVMVRGT
jgi:hypothetical protein